MCPLVPEAVSYFAGEKFANSSYSEVANFLSPTSWVAGMSSAKKKGDDIGTGFAKGLGYDATKVALVFGGIGAAGGMGASAAGAGGAGSAGAGAGTSSISKLALTAMGLQLGGGAAGAYGSYRQGIEESKALNREAKLEEQRANLAYESSAQEKRDLMRRQRQVIGKAKTMAAANGVLLDNSAVSSPNIYAQDALDEVKYESDKIDYNTELEAYTRRESAWNMRKNARTARRSGMLRAATSLITAGAGALGTYYGARS